MIKEIENLKEHYIINVYSQTRKEQKTDQTYIDDTFNVEEVKSPHVPLRSGLGNQVVNAPAEQIVTSNPQAFFDIKKGAKESALKLSREVNGEWIEILRRQNPNLFKDSVKNKLGRGENLIRVCHNQSWVTKPIQRIGLPVLFLIPDPMVVYSSPEEDDCGWFPNSGVPNKVIVFHERQLQDIIVRYPSWSNPKKKDKEKVEWLEYYDKNRILCFADDETVLDAKNLYGFNPWVRERSGFGRRSPDGELSNLIVSDIRWSRDLLKEECIMRSDIASVMHLSAHKAKIITSPGAIDDGAIKELSFGAYDISKFENFPEGAKIEDLEIDQPTVEAFQHLRDIKMEISQRYPLIMAGFPVGSSGRQQDLSSLAAMRRYDTIIENTESEWATAIEMALAICNRIPTLKPDGLRKSDLASTYVCNIELRAKDPIEEDRLITLGDRLRRQPNPAIDLGTFHTQFMGMTEDESKQIQTNILADLVTIYNPDWVAVAGMVAAEEGGMEDWLGKLAQKQQGMQQEPPTTQQRIQGEVQPGGETEGTRGGRRPPERYERG